MWRARRVGSIQNTFSPDTFCVQISGSGEIILAKPYLLPPTEPTLLSRSNLQRKRYSLRMITMGWYRNTIQQISPEQRNSIPHLKISSFGVIPKRNEPNKWYCGPILSPWFQCQRQYSLLHHICIYTSHWMTWWAFLITS